MAIEQKWKKYAQETMFNFFILPEYIQQKWEPEIMRMEMNITIL